MERLYCWIVKSSGLSMEVEDEMLEEGVGKGEEVEVEVEVVVAVGYIHCSCCCCCCCCFCCCCMLSYAAPRAISACRTARSVLPSCAASRSQNPGSTPGTWMAGGRSPWSAASQNRWKNSRSWGVEGMSAARGRRGRGWEEELLLRLPLLLRRLSRDDATEKTCWPGSWCGLVAAALW